MYTQVSRGIIPLGTVVRDHWGHHYSVLRPVEARNAYAMSSKIRAAELLPVLMMDTATHATFLRGSPECEHKREEVMSNGRQTLSSKRFHRYNVKLDAHLCCSCPRSFKAQKAHPFVDSETRLVATQQRYLVKAQPETLLL